MDVKNNNKLLMAFCVYSWTNSIVRASGSIIINATQQKKLRTYWEKNEHFVSIDIYL